MTESKPPEGNLAEEFRNLAKNLSEAMRTAWESPERRKLQQEIENGLAELGNTLKQEAETFKESQAGQQFRSEVEDVSQRIRSGEVESRIREELLSALRMANSELRKVSERWSSDRPPGKSSQES